MTTDASDALFDRFAGNLAPDERVRVLTELMTIKAIPKHAADKRFGKGLDHWISLANAGDTAPRDRLLAIAELVRATQQLKTRQPALLQRLAPAFEQPLPALTLLEDFDADQDLVARVIKNFRLTCGSGSPQADIETILKSHPISQSKVRDIADHMCGVVKRRVDEMLEVGMPAVIGRDEFKVWYGAYVRKIDRETVLLSRAKAPSEEESKGHLPRIFVQQLDLIGMTFEDQLEAVSNYLMAAADRTDWALSGEVDRTSFDDLDAALKNNWKNTRLACKVAHGGKPRLQSPPWRLRMTC